MVKLANVFPTEFSETRGLLLRAKTLRLLNWLLPKVVRLLFTKLSCCSLPRLNPLKLLSALKLRSKFRRLLVKLGRTLKLVKVFLERSSVWSAGRLLVASRTFRLFLLSPSTIRFVKEFPEKLVSVVYNSRLSRLLLLTPTTCRIPLFPVRSRVFKLFHPKILVTSVRLLLLKYASSITDPKLLPSMETRSLSAAFRNLRAPKVLFWIINMSLPLMSRPMRLPMS